MSNKPAVGRLEAVESGLGRTMTELPGQLVKQGLTHVGSRCSAGVIHRLNAAIDYLEVGRWFRDRGFTIPSRTSTREALFGFAAAEVSSLKTLYLEFGVYEGASIRTWSNLLSHPESRLHGFDTFTGLPETWNLDAPAGKFSTEGAIPQIGDPRVSFYPGRFEDSLPTYVPPPHDAIVVNIDSDLYSSAEFVLRWAEPLLRPGAFLYFDEFSDRAHELRAFNEFLNRTHMRFTVFGATRTLAQVMFRLSA